MADEEDDATKKQKLRQEMEVEENASAKSKSRYKPKRAYMGFIFFVILLCCIMRYGATEILSHLYSFDDCANTNADVQAVCLGNQAVYRITFAGTMFFMCMACLTCPRCSFHDGYWCIKVPIFLGLIAVSFFIPNLFFNAYAEVARVASLIFIFLQVIILIDLGYDLHEYILDPTGDGADPDIAKSAQCKYLFLSVSCLLVAIVGSALLWGYFGDCNTNITMITVSFVVGLLLTFLSILNCVDKGLLTPAVVWSYCVYMTWQSIWSNPDPICNPYAGASKSTGGTIVGIVITCLSIAWASTSAAASAPDLFRSPNSEDTPSQTEEEAADGREAKANVYYHVVMTIGCFYIAMLLTNWGTSNGNTQTSVESMWIKYGSVLGVFVLYLWTLIAPIVCTGRDFSDNHNRFRS